MNEFNINACFFCFKNNHAEFNPLFFFIAILNSIKSRRLDSFFELEEKIMSKSSSVEVKNVIDLITDPSAGTEEDKMRLFIIYYLCSSQISEEEYNKFESALTAANCDTKPMSYMKRWK
jgi:sec1 family domain-containing protein 1